ncbi:MAG: hypothetical protein QXT28_06895 [Thermofilaceae archaeon]
MLRAAATALVMLFTLTVGWLIAVPLFDYISSSLRSVAEEQNMNSAAVNVIDSARSIVGTLLAVVGAAGVLAIVVWLFVYAYRREVDTYTIQ